MIHRRDLVRLSAAATPALLLPATLRAQFRVEISGVGATQVPISVLRLRDEERAPVQLSAVVRADLERSGLFKLIDGAGTVMDETGRPSFGDWRGKGCDALAAGSVARLADGRFDVRYRLWDVVKGSDLAGQAVAVPKDDLRLAAHRIADEIYQKLTGESGVFSTRIAYVSKTAGRYTLWVADADGEGAQVAVAGPEPIISPAWSPDGRTLAYVSFEARKAMVYVQEVASGKRRVIAGFKGSNSAPAWSPDGTRLVVTLTRDGLSQLYGMNRNGEDLQRLTNSNAIDTEATYSPDGKSIYFVSDRGGGPQIYRMPARGGNAERVTFNGAYNISPAISPDGRYMAFVTRLNGNTFRLALMDLGSGTVTTLTDTSDDESPWFAPNSRLIIYASRAGGRDVLMTTTLDGSIKARLNAPQADVREPVWGPYGR
ncbi:MAG TPA: Tol-Pal system beta propeller repeat protein TolB [Burkholderiaceae bacterium]|nr:Tol-Pal system beta propeller repeat protein TolB [Burkholderiaceae bacterium]HMX10574.1 Tol-Pal system beta propeller repeat protein TolB [Burkholderiaceae bacterium]HMZ02504.1 Tol-Pal system beta propeller repeat protein TolB [Burkholderiaceae bacterium]HNB47369.1 Tol-Pal system beta propeller repeat protein TolB [Burkholderiaceae bacterium]